MWLLSRGPWRGSNQQRHPASGDFLGADMQPRPWVEPGPVFIGTISTWGTVLKGSEGAGGEGVRWTCRYSLYLELFQALHSLLGIFGHLQGDRCVRPPGGGALYHLPKVSVHSGKTFPDGEAGRWVDAKELERERLRGQSHPFSSLMEMQILCIERNSLSWTSKPAPSCSTKLTVVPFFHRLKLRGCPVFRANLGQSP